MPHMSYTHAYPRRSLKRRQPSARLSTRGSRSVAANGTPPVLARACNHARVRTCVHVFARTFVARAYMRECVRACIRASTRACACARVHVCATALLELRRSLGGLLCRPLGCILAQFHCLSVVLPPSHRHKLRCCDTLSDPNCDSHRIPQRWLRFFFPDKDFAARPYSPLNTPMLHSAGTAGRHLTRLMTQRPPLAMHRSARDIVVGSDQRNMNSILLMVCLLCTPYMAT